MKYDLLDLVVVATLTTAGSLYGPGAALACAIGSVLASIAMAHITIKIHS
jgi:integral membrane sensor domain MASE1